MVTSVHVYVELDAYWIVLVAALLVKPGSFQYLRDIL